jgi:hypothetical protein
LLEGGKARDFHLKISLEIPYIEDEFQLIFEDTVSLYKNGVIELMSDK